MGAADCGALSAFYSSPLPTPSLASDLALAEQAAHCGRMLEAAMKSGDRDLALVWQAAMFGVVRLRRERRFGPDISGVAAGGVHGG